MIRGTVKGLRLHPDRALLLRKLLTCRSDGVVHRLQPVGQSDISGQGIVVVILDDMMQDVNICSAFLRRPMQIVFDMV